MSLHKFNIKEFLLIIFLSLISSLTIFFADNYLLRALLSLLYLLTVAVQPLNNYIFYLVLALPNTRTMGLFDVSVALGVVVLYVFKKGLQYKNLSVNNKFICLLVCYLIYSLQYLIRFSSITYGIIMPIKDVVVFLFLYQICLKVNERDSYVSYQFLNKVVIYWFIGIIVALIPSMVISENITRYRVLNNDANILSVELVFLISVLSVLYIEANAITFKKYIILSSACFILCFATGSRTGLLLLAIVIALTIINSMASISKLLKVLFIILIGLFLFMRLDIIKTFINNLEVRNAILENKGDISNGRFYLWKSYIDAFNQNWWVWFFGAGSFPFMGFSFSAHNGIIEDICSLGIFGILLTIFIYISIFSQVKIFNFGKNNVRNKWFYFVPILVPIGGSIFLHSIRNIPNYTMILIGFLLCDTIVKSKVTINEKVSAI